MQIGNKLGLVPLACEDGNSLEITIIFLNINLDKLITENSSLRLSFQTVD